MFDKLEGLLNKYNELTEKISDPDVISDQNTWRKLMKEQAMIKDVADKYKKYKEVKKQMDEAKELMSDPDMKEMAEEEYYSCKESLEKMEDELKILLLPKDVNDDNNVIIEIRGGAGGEEAALFAYNLYRMYTMYADLKRWQVEVIDINDVEEVNGNLYLLGRVKNNNFSTNLTTSPLVEILNYRLNKIF